MYKIASDKYECDYCGYENSWDAHDDVHGELWGCEHCGKTFCSKCFIEKYGESAYQTMMQSHDLIACPDCYNKEQE